MNPVSDDSLDWLASVGLVVVEERAGGSARSLGGGAAGVADDVETALARALHLEPTDARIRSLVREARGTGAASSELAGARIALHRRSDRLLRAVVSPVDRTAASVVHELANALTGIAGWVRLAGTSGPLPERAKNALEVLDRSSADALDTARTLLASVRGGDDVAGGCEVSDVVGAAIATLRPLADDKNIVLRARIPIGLWAATHPAELRSIATNLVKNAIEALEPGGEIVISIEHQDDRVVLTVVDDGPGMDEQTLAHVFDPWFSSKSGGSGLGLALVRDLARARGGEVRAESGRGRGARFVVRLPSRPAPPQPGEAPAPQRRQRGSGVRRRSTSSMKRPLRVLVVDDDETLRTMVSTALGLRGMLVTAVDGVGAAASLRARFDIALVDLTLRDGRGDQLIGWLRERSIASRIVLTTGAVVAPAESAGATAVLRKPFAIDDLVELIERLAPEAKARAR